MEQGQMGGRMRGGRETEGVGGQWNGWSERRGDFWREKHQWCLHLTSFSLLLSSSISCNRLEWFVRIASRFWRTKHNHHTVCIFVG